jgi:hypothetical protein
MTWRSFQSFSDDGLRLARADNRSIRKSVAYRFWEAVLEKAGRSADDLVEINQTFARVAIHSLR